MDGYRDRYWYTIGGTVGTDTEDIRMGIGRIYCRYRYGIGMV